MILFTSNNCAYCTHAKELLSAKGIPCTVVNISTDAKAKRRMMTLGSLSVPTLFTGSDVLIGEQIAEALNHKSLED